MNSLLGLMLAATVASGALAGLDPAADSFGIYFDMAGNTNCVAASAWQPLPAYLVLLNPSGPTDGFECSVSMTGAPYILLSTTYSADCGPEPDWNWILGDYGCAGSTPFAAVNGAVVLVTWSIMLHAPAELLFHIGPASTPSLPGRWPVLVGDGNLRYGAISSGNAELPVAAINAANCPVSEEVASFGGVKSLFR